MAKPKKKAIPSPLSQEDLEQHDITDAFHVAHCMAIIICETVAAIEAMGDDLTAVDLVHAAYKRAHLAYHAAMEARPLTPEEQADLQSVMQHIHDHYDPFVEEFPKEEKE